VVQSLRIQPPARVLDLGCGDGTTALPLAQAGVDVTGIDIARNLVDAGNRRAREAGVTHLRFLHGDACSLDGVDNATFDATISVFGAMFAPRPYDVAREMVRVTRDGGRIIMGNWIPGDPTFVSQVLRISSTYMPPPPAGFVSPMTWGVEDQILERFGKAGVPESKVSVDRDTFYFISADKSPEQFIDLFERFYGPTMNAVDAARKTGREDDLHRELVDLANSKNQGKNGGTSIPATFMRVTVNL